MHHKGSVGDNDPGGAGAVKSPMLERREVLTLTSAMLSFIHSNTHTHKEGNSRSGGKGEYYIPRQSTKHRSHKCNAFM